MTKQWLRPDEVAAHFRVSMKTVYRWVRQKNVESCRIKGVLRISKASVEGLEAGGRVKTRAAHQKLSG